VIPTEKIFEMRNGKPPENTFFRDISLSKLILNTGEDAHLITSMPGVIGFELE
jgi:hypothetical protein